MSTCNETGLPIPHQPPARQPLIIRASSLDRVMACGPSLEKPEVRIVTDEAAANLGTAVHEFLRRAIPQHSDNWGAESLLAAEAKAGASDDLTILCGRAWVSWLKVRDAFPDPETEVEFVPYVDEEAGVTLTGHADVVSVAGNALRICDHKTGWLDVPNEHQLRAYCWLGMNEDGAITEATATTLRIREGTAETFRFTRDELREWWGKVVAQVTRGRDVYRPGDACRFCPRKLSCPAHREMIRSAAWLLSDADEPAPTADTLALYPPAELARILKVARALEDFAALAQSHLRTLVDAAGGRLVDEQGRGLELVESQRREIDAERGWPVLQRCNRLADAVKVSLGELEKAYKAQVSSGSKGAEWAAYLAELEAAGALERRTVRSLKVVSGAKQLEGVPY